MMETRSELEDSGSSNKGKSEATPWGCRMADGAASKSPGSTAQALGSGGGSPAPSPQKGDGGGAKA